MRKFFIKVFAIAITTALLLQGMPVAAQEGTSRWQEDVHSIDSDSVFYDEFYVAGCGPDAPIQGGGVATNNIQGFVDAYGQAAFNVGKKNGIPYDAILAQAALESGYGKSELTKTANNFFGMKAGSNWNGPTVSRRTAEQNADGSVYYVVALFRAYPTPEAGFQGYADFIRGIPRYKEALKYPKDPVRYIQAVKDAGYATDVNYVSKVVNILQGVQTYIAEKGLFPPSSQVEPDVAAPDANAGSEPSGGCAPTAGAGGTVADIAIREAQNWVWKNGAFKKYTQGRSENWCADFVSWVYHEAGRPLSAPPNLGQAGGWQIPAVTNMRTYLEQKGQFWLKATAPPPQPGDIVIQKNGASHTNIIVWASGYMVKTVGGNEGQTSGAQGSWHEGSGVRMSDAPFDIRKLSAVTGWGRLP